MNINKQCNKGRTPLHYACCSFNTQLVKDLLECGADIYIADERNKPLRLTGIGERQPHEIDYIADHDGFTALHTASLYDIYQLSKS